MFAEVIVKIKLAYFLGWAGLGRVFDVLDGWVGLGWVEFLSFGWVGLSCVTVYRSVVDRLRVGLLTDM